MKVDLDYYIYFGMNLTISRSEPSNRPYIFLNKVKEEQLLTRI